jgi:energy-coupling factor transporter ATP-binding protein EcfA2
MQRTKLILAPNFIQMKQIMAIEVSNSEFFVSDFRLDFSHELNCLMGGRGTGKSTILHFMRACLEKDAEENEDTFNVLKSNLGAGIIKLHFSNANGEKYKIEKSLGEDPQAYLESGEHVRFESIEREFYCDIFPAQKIEEIGRNNLARLELIDKMVYEKVAELQDQMESMKIELEKNAKDIRGENKRLASLNAVLLEFAGAEDEFKLHKENVTEKINEEENKEFEKQDAAEKIRGAEKRYIKKISENLASHLEQYVEINENLNTNREFAESTDKFFNLAILGPFKKEFETAIVGALKNNASSETQIQIAQKILNTVREKLELLHDAQHNSFIQLKQRLEKNKAFYDKLNSLSKRVDQRNITLKEIEEVKTKRKKLKQVRDKNILAFNKIKSDMLNSRLEKIKELNSIFDGRIKITITKGGITDDYEDAVRNALKGHNLRYNTIVPYLVNNFSPDGLAKVVHDHDVEKLKAITSIDIERSKAILEALYETEAIYDIETIYCPDLPDFYLKIDKEDSLEAKTKENYKKSDELSTGQRCTTVLPIIFALSRNPLIIDQPEDNLDNKYISETIHKIIKEQKKERQLLFITHNANIPVLSHSEKNYFLRFDDQKSQIADKGNVNEVKNSILNLLEGGKQAFEERKNLYGF